MSARWRAVLAIAIFGSQALAPAVVMACPPPGSGSVHDTNTIDYVNFTGNFSAGTYVLGVKAEGDGNNDFDIKVQIRGSGGGWSTIASDTIDMGSTSGCGYREVQFVLASSSEIRYRFSRAIATKQVDYEWDHDFLVLWGGQSFRCLTC